VQSCAFWQEIGGFPVFSRLYNVRAIGTVLRPSVVVYLRNVLWLNGAS